MVKGRPKTRTGASRDTVQVYIRGGDEVKHMLKILAAARQTSVADLVWQALEAQYGEELEVAKKFVTTGTNLDHMAKDSANG